MNKPILVILAAGMGSRYGGLKQIDPIGPNREILMDYSLFDAVRAGFERVIFVVKKENQVDFAAAIGNRLAGRLEVQYAYQEITDLPAGYNVPAGRIKPWGTGHAVWAARDLIDAPFCVINADDYYGPEAYRIAYSFLRHYQGGDLPVFLMVAYELLKTLSDHGSVSRGICEISSERELLNVVEHTNITRQEGQIVSTDGEGKRHNLPETAAVSMNFWGFGPEVINYMQRSFPAFLDRALVENPLKSEYFLPAQIAGMIADGVAKVAVRSCPEQWYGVTYHEDKPIVVAAIRQMIADGRYPSPLWSKA